jgi:hypothetical protein
VQGRSARKHLASKIVEKYADGRWHTRTASDEALPQYATEDIEAVLRGMRKGRYGVRAEKKANAETYRIYKGDKTVNAHQLREELGPLIKKIFEASQGLGKMMGNLHPQAQRYAVIIDRDIQRLKQIFERLT